MSKRSASTDPESKRNGGSWTSSWTVVQFKRGLKVQTRESIVHGKERKKNGLSLFGDLCYSGKH